MTGALASLLVLLSNASPFEARAKELFEATSAPGMSCAVRYPDGRVEAVAFGLANPETKDKLTPAHKMLAGSTGKTFFAAAILQLVSEGKLDLNAPLGKYLGSRPWFHELPNAGELTLKVLLNHTSGIPEYVADAEVVSMLRANPDQTFGHEELVSKFIAGKKPLFAAGKGWSYADANYVLAGVAAEAGAKVDLYAEIERRLLRKFSLTRTAPSTTRNTAGFAIGVSMPNSPFLPAGPVAENGKFRINPQFEWAGGGFASTPGDLAVWMYEFVAGGALQPDIRKQMLDAVPAKTGPADRYGLGVMIEPLSLGTSFGHEGWFPGYLTQAACFPDTGISIAVQFNTDHGAALKRRTRYFIDELAKAAMSKGSLVRTRVQ